MFLELFKDIENVLYLIKELINPNIIRYSILIRHLTSVDACPMLILLELVSLAGRF